MTTTTATTATATAVASGVEYIACVERGAVALFKFGKELDKALKGSKNRDGVKLAIATQVAGKTGRTVKTIQNKITLALDCFNTHENIAAVKHWVLEEKEAKAKAIKETRYTKRVNEMSITFNQLADDEVNALLAKRKAFLKASK